MYSNKDEVFSYLLSELAKHKCVIVNGRDTTFPRWQNERQKYVCTGEHKGQNVREILPNEIIIEFDEIGENPISKVQEQSNKWIELLKSWLEQKGFSFYVTNHGGKSSHIRFQLQGLENYEPELRKQYKLRLVKRILEEIGFKSNLVKLDESLIATKNKLLSLELQPHFKTKYNGAKEDIIYIHDDKVNQFDKELLEEITREQHKSNLKHTRKSEPNSINIIKLKEYFEQYYQEGSRNNLTLAFGGMMYHIGFSLEDAEDLLFEIIDDVNPAEFNERKNQLKYCFSGDKNISVRHWINQVFPNIKEEEQEQKYQEFKAMFELPSDRHVQVKSGKFYIEVINNVHWLKYVNDTLQTVSRRPIETINTYNQFNTFVKQNKILIDGDAEIVRSEITKLNNLIKVNKDNIQSSIDSFFTDHEFYENNQLFYNGEFAYTMCNGDHTILVTFNNIISVDGNSNFLKLPKIRSNLISPAGLKRLKAKQVNENIFNDVKEYLNDYLDYEQDDLLLKTLWTFHTYTFNLCGNTVYLHFTGQPGTGKSTAQKVLNQICWNSEYCCNLSEASLFREVDALQNTLHLDEVDKWSKEKQESIQALLNNGYSKGGVVKRVSGSDGNYKVERFRVFCPKTLTSNNPNFLDSFKTRCLDIIPQKAIRHLKNIDVLSDEDKKRITKLRDDIYIYMLKYGANIFEIYKKEISDTTKISTREQQLLAVLDCFNIHFGLNLDLKQIMDDRKDEYDPEFDQYNLILKMLAERMENGICIITTKELVERLNRSIYGDNLLRQHDINNITIGNRMKELGFKKYKKQTRNGQRLHHYAIPEKLIRQKLTARGIDIQLPQSSQDDEKALKGT